MDAIGGRKGYTLATLALIALASALSYSVGLQHGAKSSSQQPLWSEAPVEPRTVALMRDAAERARAEGDIPTAEWFESVAQRQMEQMVSWASSQRNGTRRPASAGE